MTDTTDPQTFDGCNSECRKAGKHTLRWGGCEHAPKPEPTVSMSKIYKDPEDGYPSIGFDSYTVPELARLIEPAVGDPLRAVAAARAIVHRNDDPAAAPPAPADRSGLRERIAGALWPLTDWDGDQLNAEAAADAVLSVLPPAAVRAAVLREAADAITAVIERDRAYSPRRSNDRAALGGAREIVLGLIDQPGRVADEAQQQCPGVETAREEVVHGCPPDGSGLTPCCGRTPFELPLTDRISSEVPVTCKGA